jgi:hypothetical protein
VTSTTTGARKAEISFYEGFWPSVHRLAPAESHRIIQALNLFAEHPDHPNLHLKPLKGRLSQLMSVRAGRDIRVLLVKRGETYVWLEAGNRRDVYDKAERGQFVVNPNRRFMGFVDATVREEERRQPLPTDERARERPGPGVFDHWSTPELVDAGFTADEVTQLRSCADEYALLALNWQDERIDLAVELVELTPEQWRAGVPAGEETILRKAITDFGGLTGISPLFSAEELARIAAAPIEDWMIFLHPDQRSIVERQYEGPARVRGAAGTGKTVVALHRAAYLARRQRNEQPGVPVLFTTVTESLPRVYEHLFRRLPEAPADDVVFLSIDEVAQRVCAAAGVELPAVHAAQVDQCFERAHAQVVISGTPLARSSLSPKYLRTEIDRVVKGRGVQSLDEYLTLIRTGRGVGLTGATRRQVWELAEAWDAECALAGTVVPGDALISALRAARAMTTPSYRSVVVDEAQDLTMVGLQLLRSLVNAGSRDRSDGLFLVGDGAQRVYPGGFTLRQAGVEVRGRTTVLRVNYRNTREILGAALAVAGEERVVDLDEEFKRGELKAATIRSGVQPVLFRYATEAAELDGLVKQIREVTATDQIGPGDTAVFGTDKDACAAVADAIAEDGITAQPLRAYDGTPNDMVKVGTYADAKGLEFKVVFLPGLSRDTGSTGHAASDDEDEERRVLELSRLFVAMTRARDVLVLSCVGEMSPLLSQALKQLEVVDA